MNPKIALLITGDEILSGDLIDSNSSFFCSELTSVGLRVEKIVTLGDDLKSLVQGLKELCRDFDVVLMNGGLGPTKDDYTSLAIAEANGETLREHPEALRQLTEWTKKIGVELNEANRKQARLSESAVPIPNSIGSAPGIFYRGRNFRIFATPGVPKEMKRMWREEILPQILEGFRFEKSKTRIFRAFGLGESKIQQILSDRSKFSDLVKLGFRASFPLVEIKSTYSSSRFSEAEKFHGEVQELFKDFLIDGTSIENEIHEKLTAEEKSLAIAESCTGGKISSALTSLAGASAFFKSGLTVYSNEAKQKLLGVSKKTLEKFGAVSGETAQEMIEGVFSETGADYAIVTTGIAGPDGGTEDKPIGTLFIGWGSREDFSIRKFWIPNSRDAFISCASILALDLLRRDLSNLEIPHYYFDKLSTTAK